MIIDSSAVLAILLAEGDALTYSKALEATGECRISAANWLETAIRVDLSGNPVASNAFDDFVREANIIIEPVSAEQVHVARLAYRAYGKGTGHPAKLNLGDCFAYALAKVTGETLLYKGQDFAQTDIAAAIDGQ